MHIAASADVSYALTYLKSQGIDSDERDSDNQTPLHWACYHGADEALYYLLAWTKQVNAIDINGQTPLHLAIS